MTSDKFSCFSQSDQFLEDSLFSDLNLDEGQQIYLLTVGFNATDYDEGTVWCDKFDVPDIQTVYPYFSQIKLKDDFDP